MAGPACSMEAFSNTFMYFEKLSDQQMQAYTDKNKLLSEAKTL